jgi:hypothetical protein
MDKHEATTYIMEVAEFHSMIEKAVRERIGCGHQDKELLFHYIIEEVGGHELDWFPGHNTVTKVKITFRKDGEE